MTSTFAVYGNEPDVGYLYGDICLVVKFGKVEGGSDDSDDSEEEVATSSESDGYY